MQYASLAIAQELPIENMKIMVRGHMQRDLPRAFTDMIFEVRLEGGASTEQVANLARDASVRCFVENTLGKAIPITTEVYLNKEKVLTLNRSPR
jgi:uncharacterized OsmC-like protein